MPKNHKKNRAVVVKGEHENIGLMIEEVQMVTQFDDNRYKRRTITREFEKLN